MTTTNSLCIRSFGSRFAVCTGTAPEGRENDGNIYMGDVISWHETFEEARAARDLIERSCTSTTENVALDACTLRALCIKHEWSTCGGNSQYSKLFDMADTDATLEDLALTIWLCSDDVDRADVLDSLKDANSPK